MSFNFADTYVMDQTAVDEGAWVPIGDGAELCVARGNNRAARKMRERMAAKYNRPGFRQKKMSDEDETHITQVVLATECLKDWKGLDLSEIADELGEKYGVEIDDPSNPSYHPDLGVALFKEYEDFYIDVMKIAADEELYRKSTQEADLGNSGPSSTGGRGGSTSASQPDDPSEDE